MDVDEVAHALGKVAGGHGVLIGIIYFPTTVEVYCADGAPAPPR